MTASQLENKCPKCGDLLVLEKPFCPNCGLAVGHLADRIAIDSYVQAKLAQELSVRLKDQSTLVREIGDKAEDVVWARLKRYGWVVTIGLVLLGFWGIKSIDDAGTKIVASASQRVEPLIKGVEAKSEIAQSNMNALDSRLAKALEDLKLYEKHIKDYESSIATSGGEALREISKLKGAVTQQRKDLTALQEQVVDFGKREIRANSMQTTGLGPSSIAFGKLGCPSVAEGLTKYGMLVAYCVQGNPLSLFQLTSTELRPVSARSSVGFQDVSNDPKPFCNGNGRGTLYVEKNNGSTADKPFLCIRKTDGTYGWVQLATN
ncbi:MAG: zinc ribbon domain-containing protein [Acidobacteriota bacterium]